MDVYIHILLPTRERAKKGNFVCENDVQENSFLRIADSKNMKLFEEP